MRKHKMARVKLLKEYKSFKPGDVIQLPQHEAITLILDRVAIRDKGWKDRMFRGKEAVTK